MELKIFNYPCSCKHHRLVTEHETDSNIVAFLHMSSRLLSVLPILHVRASARRHLITRSVIYLPLKSVIGKI